MPRPLGVRDYFFRHAFWDIVCGYGIQHKSELSHLYPSILYSLQKPATQTPSLATARSHIRTHRFLAAGALGERVRTGRALERGLAKQGMPAWAARFHAEDLLYATH